MENKSWYDEVDDAGNAYVKECEKVELMLRQAEDPNLAGFGYGLETYQLIMAAFRAGAEWQTDYIINKIIKHTN